MISFGKGKAPARHIPELGRGKCLKCGLRSERRRVLRLQGAVQKLGSVTASATRREATQKEGYR